jgi:preprotein translocase subunit SecE
MPTKEQVKNLTISILVAMIVFVTLPFWILYYFGLCLEDWYERKRNN